MKYYININQLVLSNTKLDIKDAAIIEYIKDWCLADDKKVKQLTLEEDGNSYRYTWLNLNHLISEMPLLRINQKASISERIIKIVKAGFIKTWQAPDNTLYVRLLPKIKELGFRVDTVSLNEHPCSPELTPLLAKTNSTKSILSKQYTNKDTNVQANACEEPLNQIITNTIQAFKETVNPTINFGNKTNRSAVKELLCLYENDSGKLGELVRFAIKSQGKPYAPVITTPYQLKEKLGRLGVYAKQQKGREYII